MAVVREATKLYEEVFRGTVSQCQEHFALPRGEFTLVIGGIIIMNIMLVSVTERTREIGLRRAVGAKARDILLQFIVEAITLCTLGGILGVAIALAITFGFAQFAGWPVALQWEVVVLAVLFSAAIGVFFGYYPAHKAAAQNPIEALRFE